MLSLEKARRIARGYPRSDAAKDYQHQQHQQQHLRQQPATVHNETQYAMTYSPLRTRHRPHLHQTDPMIFSATKRIEALAVATAVAGGATVAAATDTGKTQTITSLETPGSTPDELLDTCNTPPTPSPAVAALTTAAPAPAPPSQEQQQQQQQQQLQQQQQQQQQLRSIRRNPERPAGFMGLWGQPVPCVL